MLFSLLTIKKNEKRDWNLEKNNFYKISSSFEQDELA